jgi:hypothetical protein
LKRPSKSSRLRPQIDPRSSRNPYARVAFAPRTGALRLAGETNMNSIIYIIGLIVVVLIILSFLGLR